MRNQENSGKRYQKKTSTAGRDGRRRDDRSNYGRKRGGESHPRYRKEDKEGGDFRDEERGGNQRGRSFYKKDQRRSDERRRGDRPYRSESDSNRFEGKPFDKSRLRKRQEGNKLVKRIKGLKKKDDLIRLNRYLSRAGVCSRREADEFIVAGVVSVNGEIVTELGTKVKPSDVVKFHDQPVGLEKKVYVLLNKPKNCVTTMDDPRGRLTVMDLVKGACDERIYPVGRLDRNTTGVLLLTNDGDLAARLTHPRYEHQKIYHVVTDNPVKEEDMEKIALGIELEDGFIKADSVSYVDDEGPKNVGIEIHSGKNRIVRRIFESLGYQVVRLDRVFFAGLTKKGLRRGDWRHLSPKEVSFLQMNATDK